MQPASSSTRPATRPSSVRSDKTTLRQHNLQMLLDGLRSGLLDRQRLGLRNSAEGLMLQSTGMSETAVLKELGLRGTAAAPTHNPAGKERRIVKCEEVFGE